MDCGGLCLWWVLRWGGVGYIGLEGLWDLVRGDDRWVV